MIWETAYQMAKYDKIRIVTVRKVYFGEKANGMSG